MLHFLVITNNSISHRFPFKQVCSEFVSQLQDTLNPKTGQVDDLLLLLKRLFLESKIH